MLKKRPNKLIAWHWGGISACWLLIILGHYIAVESNQPFIVLSWVIAFIVAFTFYYVPKLIKANSPKSGLLIFFGNIILLILEFAIVYRITGLSSTVMSGNLGMPEYIYFSMITFSTLGYSDIFPSPGAQIVAAIEAFLGYIYMGLLIALLSGVFFELKE